MAKKKKKPDEKVYYDAKSILIKNIKRYGFVILISAPLILFLNYVFTEEIPGYNEVVAFFVTLFMLLFACFLAMVIYGKLDDKRQEKSTKESERDPFAD